MTSETEFARRSPDGVFGMVPGRARRRCVAHIDLGDNLVGDLVLDAAHLDRVLPGVGLHRHGERLAGVSGIQPDGDGTARADALHARGPLDVGQVDVAASHDDDVLHTAADDDVALIGDVAEVAGVVPAVLVLRRDEAAHGDVAGRHRFAAQLDDADAARGHHCPARR